MKSERYEVIGKEFRIFDEALQIDLVSQLEFLDTDNFPNGQVRYATYRKGQMLHGPSLFYSPQGQLLCEAWYYEGKMVGKSKKYFLDGSLYSTECFFFGLYHLVQEYFYPDQTIKTSVEYRKGVLDGETILYWPDGQIKRKILFEKGKKQEDVIYDQEEKVLAEFANTLS